MSFFSKSGGYAQPALLISVVATLVISAATFTSGSSLLGMAAAQAAGSCNLSSANWANRDDDGDDVCNGVDVCPFEADPSQDPNRCTMQAITVPFRPDNLNVPHPTYSGATITLKGIARYGGNQYMWDFGDGSTTAWTVIVDPNNLAVQHVYTGFVGRPFIATLSVRSSAAPSIVAIAAYRVQIESGADLSDQSHLKVRAQMSADEGLWYLHTQLVRSTFADGAPGYLQGYASSPAGLYTTCAVLDAFAIHGSTTTAGRSTDPYVEDAQRTLAFVLANSLTAPITAQPFGDPDVNGNGIGALLGGRDNNYENGVCAMAVADAAARTALAPAGSATIYGRSFGDIVQDAVDWFAYGQIDTGGYLGGWGYTANDGSANGENFRWPILAMSSAERKMGAVVPAFVRSNIPYFLAYSHSTAADGNNGGWGWSNPGDYVSVPFTAAGIVAHEFLGDSATSGDIAPAFGFLYRHWNDAPVSTLFGNLGDSDGMYTVMRALQETQPAPTSLVTEFNYSTGLPTSNSFDWFQAIAAAPQVGYISNLVTRQHPDGSWTDTDGGGAHNAGPVWSTAWDTMVLARNSGGGPIADIGGPYVTDINVTIQLDASRSIGSGLTYAWNLSGGGGSTFGDATGPTAATQWATYSADYLGNPLGPQPRVCVRVTDATGLSDIACTNVTVKPPPHPPLARLAAVTYGSVNVPVALSAAASSDIDGDPLTFAWDFQDSGSFADSSNVTPSVTFALPGYHVVCVKVTDHPSSNPAPYSAPESSTIACGLVGVGIIQPPVAVIASPSVSLTGPLPTTASFDGSGSYDPDGLALTYSWTFSDPGATSAPGNATTTHTFGSYGSSTAQLTVSNGFASSTATATISVVDTTPGAPTGLIATAGAGSVGLTWSAVPLATSYNVLRSTDGGVTFMPLGTAAVPSLNDAAVTPGATYAYKVRAASPGGISAPSLPATITLAPAPPTGLTATAGAGAVALAWTASPGATGYDVARSSDGGATFTSIGTAAGTSFSDVAVAPGSTYSYAVAAANAGGTSARSAAVTVSIAPPAPTLVVPALSQSLVAVSGNGLPGAVVTVSEGATTRGTFTATAAGTWSGTITLADGSHVLAARQTLGALSSVFSAPTTVTVDTVAPVIAYTGNAGSYTADQTVTIHCVASDAGTGIGSTTCADISGLASTFGIGSHTFTATATDLVGNTASATTTFTVTAVTPPPVTVTAKSVCKLAKRYIEGSAKFTTRKGEHRESSGDVAESLCEKANRLDERLTAARRAALLKAFGNEAAALVRAGWLTAAQAATLEAQAALIQPPAATPRGRDDGRN